MFNKVYSIKYVVISLFMTFSVMQSCAALAVSQDRLAHLVTLANKGNAQAAFELGVHYATRFPRRSSNDVNAVRYFTQAATAGVAEAQYNLGLFYTIGRGLSANEINAAYWYREAAKSGFAWAQYNLGMAYVSGAGVVKDFDEASRWLAMAAQQGMPEAQYNLQAIEKYLVTEKELEVEDKVWRQVSTGHAESVSAPFVISNDWVMRQPPGNFTLQVISMPSFAAVSGFIKSNDLEFHGAKVITFVREQVQWYAVMVGQFATYDDAAAMIQELPGSVKENAPWIRMFGQIQQQLKSTESGDR